MSERARKSDVIDGEITTVLKIAVYCLILELCDYFASPLLMEEKNCIFQAHTYL